MTEKPRTLKKREASITALPLYYSGHLLMRTTDKKVSDVRYVEMKGFKRHFVELRGSQLFLYKNDAQETYTEMLDLEKVESMDLTKPIAVSKIFTFTLSNKEVQLKVENPNEGEEWRCYINTMATRMIPSNAMLLPGQLLELKDALDKELSRKGLPRLRAPAVPPRRFQRSPPASPSPSALSSSPSASASSSSPQPAAAKPSPSNTDMPACFFNVTRQEAEAMLQKHPEKGNIILRPSLDGSHAVTLRLQLDSGPVMRNYKVSRKLSGHFIIHLDTPVTVNTLTDVLDHFLETLEHRLCPYSESSNIYDTHMDTRLVQMCNSSPSNIPWGEVKPMKRSQEKVILTEAEHDYLAPDDAQNPKPDLESVVLQKEVMDACSNERSFIKESSGKVGWS